MASAVPLLDGATKRKEPPALKSKSNVLRGIFVAAILVFLLIIFALSIATLIVNQNLGAKVRFCFSGQFSGELLLDSSDELASFRFQYYNLSSSVTGIQVYGPVPPGVATTTTIAFSLCGTPCAACDDVSVVNQISGTIYQRCEDSTNLVNWFALVRQQPSSYYVRVNTGVNPSGELFLPLTQTCGSTI